MQNNHPMQVTSKLNHTNLKRIFEVLEVLCIKALRCFNKRLTHDLRTQNARKILACEN